MEAGTGNALAVHLCRLNNPAAEDLTAGQIPTLPVDTLGNVLGDSLVPSGDCNPTTIAVNPELAETTLFSYDAHGNLRQLIGPTGYQIDYQHEPITQTHTRVITDSFGEQAQTKYDSDSLKFGLSRAVLIRKRRFEAADSGL